MNILKACYEKHGNIDPVIAAILLEQTKFKVIVFGGLLRDLVQNKPSSDVDILILRDGAVTYDHNTRSFTDKFIDDFNEILKSSKLISNPILTRHETKVNNINQYRGQLEEIDDTTEDLEQEDDIHSLAFKVKVDHIKYSFKLNGYDFSLDVSFSCDNNKLKKYQPSCQIDSLYVEEQFIPENDDMKQLDHIRKFFASNLKSYYGSTDEIKKDIMNKKLVILDINNVKRILKLARFILKESYSLKDTVVNREKSKMIQNFSSTMYYDKFDSESRKQYLGLKHHLEKCK